MSLVDALSARLDELASRELEPVTVAVVDSGIDATHPTLVGRVARAVRIEECDSGYTAVDAPEQSNTDVYGHGTAVAGIIAQVAPNARIIDIRVLNEQNVGKGDALVAGFRFAVAQEARVINLSLAAAARFAPALQSLCEDAYRRNQIVVASRRNMPLVDNGFPAEFSSCVSVDIGKFASHFEVLFRENHPVEFVAHGEDVRVPAAGGGSTIMTGTSFATPAVSGLCALLVGAWPDLRTFDVKSLLRAFAH